MNIFDQILASAYYVFEDGLNSHIIRQFIMFMRKFGYKFQRDDLKMNEISEYMEFINHQYKLKNGYTMDDIAPFINFDMVAIYHNLKKSRDKYYSNRLQIDKTKKKIKRK